MPTLIMFRSTEAMVSPPFRVSQATFYADLISLIEVTFQATLGRLSGTRGYGILREAACDPVVPVPVTPLETMAEHERRGMGADIGAGD
jgi:hypothetical protein